jgi:hypothetical protein
MRRVGGTDRGQGNDRSRPRPLLAERRGLGEWNGRAADGGRARMAAVDVRPLPMAAADESAQDRTGRDGIPDDDDERIPERGLIVHEGRRISTFTEFSPTTNSLKDGWTKGSPRSSPTGIWKKGGRRTLARCSRGDASRGGAGGDRTNRHSGRRVRGSDPLLDDDLHEDRSGPSDASVVDR